MSGTLRQQSTKIVTAHWIPLGKEMSGVNKSLKELKKNKTKSLSGIRDKGTARILFCCFGK